MEYTIEFIQITKETLPDGYGNIVMDTLPAINMNYKFTQEYETKKEYYETFLRRVGDMIIQRHMALLEHALQMKRTFEATYGMYQVKSYSFVFKYDTTQCPRPDEDLDPGDIRYLLQMSRYYFALQIHLEEAYRIHKRCTHYKKQAYEFKEREYQLRKSMGKISYHDFSQRHPYKRIEFPTHTEAYMRAYRNQWVKRVYDMEKYIHIHKGEATPTECKAYRALTQPADLSSLEYDHIHDEDYDPFDAGNDETKELFHMRKTMNGNDNYTTILPIQRVSQIH